MSTGGKRHPRHNGPTMKARLVQAIAGPGNRVRRTIRLARNSNAAETINEMTSKIVVPIPISSTLLSDKCQKSRSADSSRSTPGRTNAST